MKTKTTDQLKALHHQANLAYYEIGEPIMTDTDFDTLEAELISRGVDNETLSLTKTGTAVKHFTLCPSLRKANVLGEFSVEHHQNIIKKLMKSKAFNDGNTFTLDFKFDGLAINAQYIDGVLQSAVTRGDYFEGFDKIEKIRQYLPQTITNGMTEVRYECIMKTSVFVDKYADDYSHPRNLAGGILNDLDVKDVRKNDLVLAPLNGVRNGKTFINHHSLPFECERLGVDFEKLSYQEVLDFDTFKASYDRMMAKRELIDFPTDGLVISPMEADVNDTDGKKYPYHSVSIKFPPKGAQTKVSSLTWEVKRSGEIVPIVNLVPVKIDGRMISKCHGFNYGFIIGNGIEEGAIVEIVIAGDIIPYLNSVIERSDVKPTLPSESIIEGCHLLTTNADYIKVEKFVFGALELGLKDFGDSFYRQVASHYDYNPFNILDDNFSNDEILLSLGFSSKKVTKFMARINDKKSIKLKQLIRVLSIPNCGEGTSEEVAKFFAKDVIKVDAGLFDVDYDFARKQHLVIESCTNVEGEGYNLILKTLKSLNENGIEIIYADEKKVIEGDLDEIKYIMTGSPKAFDFKTKAIFKATLPSNYTEVKKINDAVMLITDDLESKSSKMKKADGLGLVIKTYGDF